MIKLKIETHDGETHVQSVESYDAFELNEDLNDNDLNTVIIGDLVISRINVKSVNPIVDQDESAE